MSELDWSDWSLEEASFDNMKEILNSHQFFFAAPEFGKITSPF